MKQNRSASHNLTDTLSVVMIRPDLLSQHLHESHEIGFLVNRQFEFQNQTATNHQLP